MKYAVFLPVKYAVFLPVKYAVFLPVKYAVFLPVKYAVFLYEPVKLRFRLAVFNFSQIFEAELYLMCS